MALAPETFTRALANLTRLRILVLLFGEEELFVCELTESLALPQLKTSRHLAVLREAKILLDRRSGLWIQYRLHPDLPAWARDALAAIARGCIGKAPFDADRAKRERSLLRLTGTCG